MTNVVTVPAGYQELREQCAWIDLSSRGRIQATGEDRARLLHAMTTNHVQGLAEGSGCYLFFLNAQGRILGDANLIVRADHMLLDTEPETRAKLFAHLDKYIIADDVILEDVTDSTVCLSIEGPEAAAKLESIGAVLPAEDYASAPWGALLIQKISSTGQSGFRVFAPVSEKDTLIASLQSAGIMQADAEAQRVVRIENGKPRYGDDITESSLPQETRQMHALHFQKGCYVGQEIVERIRSRGHVNRVLARLVIDGSDTLAPGSKVMADAKEAGAISSAAWSPALAKTVALGFIRVEALEGKAPLTVNGSRAEGVPA